MKKIATVLLSCLLFTTCLAACKQTSHNNGGEEMKDAMIKDKKSLEYAYNGLELSESIKDETNGFETVKSLSGARFFVNGEYASEFTETNSRQDVKMELFNDTAVRMVNLSGGIAYTLPSTEITVDYTIAKYRSSVRFDDSILSVSVESSNPYMNNATPWYIYGTEWLLRHLLSEDYYENQDLTLLKATECNFDAEASDHNYGDTITKEGFDLYRFDVQINDANDKVEHPFYNIAVIRKVGDEKNFSLFVMKSESNKSEVMDAIVQSYQLFTAKGVPRNYFNAGTVTEDPNWNEETLAYFRQISTSKTLNWGVFSYSISGTGLNPGEGDYDSNYEKSKAMKDGIEAATDYMYDIYPTYTHISYGTNMHYFNVPMSAELAGGNGVNGKPVLQFTYQFTTNNNLVDEELTPMFDILRGEYDEYFHRLAQDIKEYGKPVLLRLNNEMNTDWTSYSGMMTLLDPDVFNMTWQRLYNIFIEEGVDNVIWIWNPIAVSCPYSSWGEDLCYFPGKDYVQLLGATDYEMNNYAIGDDSIMSFAERYNELYKKNCENGFESWGLIISEFACGSGGDVSGELGRNGSTQAAWVSGMFDEFCKDEQPAYVQQIKGMVWFNCNDYVGKQISNRLRFFDPNSNDYDDLTETISSFRDGFARLMQKYGTN